MASVTYTAASRATLVASHVVGTSYSIDLKLRSFGTSLDMPKTVHAPLNGAPETVLRSATRIISASLSWPDANNEDVEEFLWSIAGGELFTFDAYGTVASPDDPLDVMIVNRSISMAPIQRIKATSRIISLTMRPLVSKL